tara:strand:- start:206 stop:445 length:240 start_codon:yes stop_codon:yes gene_type:complete
MKITKTQLRRVIKEEISKAIEEGEGVDFSHTPGRSAFDELNQEYDGLLQSMEDMIPGSPEKKEAMERLKQIVALMKAAK